MEQFIDVLIESPAGCRNKYKFDEKTGSFRLKKILPLGAAFPYEFGFVPGTLAEDGDPIDVMVLIEEPTFTGCILPCRIIGAILAEQTKNTKTVRNDRLIAVAEASFEYRSLRELSEVPGNIISHIEHFFVSYNKMEGKTFEPIGRVGAADALALLNKAKVKTAAK